MAKVPNQAVISTLQPQYLSLEIVTVMKSLQKQTPDLVRIKKVTKTAVLAIIYFLTPIILLFRKNSKKIA